MDGLPHRLNSRRTAAELVELLNYTEGSPLEGLLKQQTNPAGVIQDTIMQRVIMTSLSDGALRELIREEDGLEQCFKLLSAFFEAVAETRSLSLSKGRSLAGPKAQNLASGTRRGHREHGLCDGS